MRAQSGGAGQRKRRRRSGAMQPMAEINVTPFVDVMLVLLIIFMVAAPLVTSGVPVDLPDSAAPPLPTPEEPPLTVTLAGDGRILIEETEIVPQTLVTRLSAIAHERRDRQIYLRADGTIPYAQVMQVMGALTAGGFTSIGLITDDGGPRLDAPEISE
ncbi:MAG: protein TolR [Pseudomonadota bacterium]